MTTTDEFDYIIVGAGSAGCTLASRLTEDPGTRVLVLEAGGWDRDFWLHIPLAWGRNVLQRRADWMYSSALESGTGNRHIAINRGKVVGGSSSINGLAYVRGHRGDYDRWAAAGLEQWSYAQVLPYFRRQEHWQGGASAYRGGDGPLSTVVPKSDDPINDALIEAGARAGFPFTDDYNGAQQEGFCRSQSTIKDGRRCSAAVAYLHPALARGSNLTVETEALARRIVFEGARAVGIEYEQRGETRIARAGREVILAGGAINSPHLLMLSGIGDGDELKRHGIAVKLHQPQIGKNLQDHMGASVDANRTEPGPLHRALRLDRIAFHVARAHFFGTGIAASIMNNVMAYLKSDPSEKLPDVQFLFRVAPLDAAPYLPPFRPAFVDGYGCRAVVLRPESRGRLSLASADPRAPIRIEPNFFSRDKDLKVIRDGLRMAREVLAQAPLGRFGGSESVPGKDKLTDAELNDYIRATATTVYHPLGTCKMGGARDAAAVVDPELKLKGIDGLRVVDASAMPDLVGGNINAPVIMIAEKAADLIRGRQPLAPVNV
ncbi:MAG TPA: choline dehydrogenase [Stellaceae bacterium]|nr:choline dehydrogenase [Stellaceae bacterium]